MTPAWRRVLVWGGAAAFCALAFYLALTRSLEFGAAGIVRALLRALPPGGQETMHVVFAHLPVDEDPAAWVVRKLASVVFFAAIGVIARIVAGRRARTRAQAVLVAFAGAIGMSAAIEAYEYPEAFGDVAFDLACGAVGGLLAVTVDRKGRRSTMKVDGRP